VKAIACQDAHSVAVYKKVVATHGEVYLGAKLEVVDWDKVSSKPRARVWVSAKGEVVKYGLKKVAVRIYKSDSKNRSTAVEEHVEPDLDMTEVSDIVVAGESDSVILEWYLSEENDLARGLRGVGVQDEDDLLLKGEEDADKTVVEMKSQDVPQTPADKSSQ